MTNFLLFWHIRCSCGAIQFIRVPPTLQRCHAMVLNLRLPCGAEPRGAEPLGTWGQLPPGKGQMGLGSPQLRLTGQTGSPRRKLLATSVSHPQYD